MHVLYEGALDMPTRLCYDNATGGIKPPHKILLDYTTILVFTQNSGNSPFSHYDPNMVEWFVKMVEERKQQHDSSKEKKNW